MVGKPEVTAEFLDHLEAEIQNQELSIEDMGLLLDVLRLAKTGFYCELVTR